MPIPVYYVVILWCAIQCIVVCCVTGMHGVLYRVPWRCATCILLWQCTMYYVSLRCC